ncbi:hypothetical protein [Halarcobacter sp.]|uniref:hypothetical protein n=1 Tax=Halarcobacter sp. TaxID=2321133 RepID=UPI002AAA8B2D|nr:hypothetical protein [Halarcobacter sp.]
MIELICKILHIGKTTYYKYLKEDYPIIKFLHSLSKEELEELLITGQLKKLENPNNSLNKINDISEVLIDDTIFKLRDKLQHKTDGSLLNLVSGFISKGLLTRVVKELSSNKKLYTITNSKDFLIDRIKNEDEKISEKFGKKKELLNYIEYNLSKLECFVLINYYEEVMNYPNYLGKKPKF